jgi:hypothetical protein
MLLFGRKPTIKETRQTTQRHILITMIMKLPQLKSSKLVLLK